MATRCRCHPREAYLTCVQCPKCKHWSFDPWASACERRRCGYVQGQLIRSITRA